MHRSSPVTSETQDVFGIISANSERRKQSCDRLSSLGPFTPEGHKELTLTNAYRQMDIQLVNSFSTTVSVLKESMGLVT